MGAEEKRLGRMVAKRLREAERKARDLAEIRREYGEDVGVLGDGTPEAPYLILDDAWDRRPQREP